MKRSGKHAPSSKFVSGTTFPEIILTNQDQKVSWNLSSPSFNIESKLAIDNTNSFQEDFWYVRLWLTFVHPLMIWVLELETQTRTFARDITWINWVSVFRNNYSIYINTKIAKIYIYFCFWNSFVFTNVTITSLFCLLLLFAL